MTQKNQRYSVIAILLHWVMALMILFLFGLGWYMVELPETAVRSGPFSLHKSIGLTVLILLVLRVIWRHTHRPPPLPADMPTFKRRLADSTHVLLYLLMILQPVTGYLSSSFSGYKTKLWGVPLPHWGWKDAVLNEFFTELHVICSLLFVLLVITHVIGALSHVLSKGDNVFRRMLPW